MSDPIEQVQPILAKMLDRLRTERRIELVARLAVQLATSEERGDTDDDYQSYEVYVNDAMGFFEHAGLAVQDEEREDVPTPSPEPDVPLQSLWARA